MALELKYVSNGGGEIVFSASPQSGRMPDYSLFGVEGIHGLENELFTSARHHIPGVTVDGKRQRERNIRISGKIWRDVVTNRIKMLRIMNPEHSGTLYLIRGDTLLKMDCEIAVAPKFPAENGRMFTVELMGANPYWEDVEEKTIWVAGVDPLFEWPIDVEEGVGFEFGRRHTYTGYNYLRSAYIDGDVETPVVIEFTAARTFVNNNLSLLYFSSVDATNGLLTALKQVELNIIAANYNYNTQQYVYDYRFIYGDKITVSTDRRNITVIRKRGEKEENYIHILENASMVDLYLQPGGNILRMSGGIIKNPIPGAPNDLEQIDVKIRYRNRYLGV